MSVNIMKIATSIAQHTSPVAIIDKKLNKGRGAEAVSEVIGSDAGRGLAKAVATYAAPEFAPITRPIIDKLSKDATELNTASTDYEKFGSIDGEAAGAAILDSRDPRNAEIAAAVEEMSQRYLTASQSPVSERRKLV